MFHNGMKIAMVITETCFPASEAWQANCIETKRRALDDLIELVKGPCVGENPKPIDDPIMWVHRAFDMYRKYIHIC